MLPVRCQKCRAERQAYQLHLITMHFVYKSKLVHTAWSPAQTAPGRVSVIITFRNNRDYHKPPDGLMFSFLRSLTLKICYVIKHKESELQNGDRKPGTDTAEEVKQFWQQIYFFIYGLVCRRCFNCGGSKASKCVSIADQLQNKRMYWKCLRTWRQRECMDQRKRA